VALAAVAAPASAAPAAASAAANRPLGCLIEPDRVADIGSQVVGLVERLNVERGDLVTSGQTLMSLRADVERANAGAAGTRAAVDADEKAAVASLELAQQKVQRAESLVAQNFISDQALEQARGEAEVARQKLSQSRSQRRIWADERRVAQAQLALRTVRSPFDGVVVERFVNLGERVEERPVMRVAVIDPLRVELMVPTAHYGAIATGDRLVIRPELPGVDAVTATVKHIDRVFDAASNSFRVRLSLPNPGNRLPAGLRCKADLPTAASGSAPAARSAAPAASPASPRTAPAGTAPSAKAPAERSPVLALQRTTP
jgi:membrane fusion protein, heavy metal efflux system